MPRAAALALVLFALLIGDARAADQIPVYVVDGPLPSGEGAFGLLVAVLSALAARQVLARVRPAVWSWRPATA